jgi:hypothetical protein
MRTLSELVGERISAAMAGHPLRRWCPLKRANPVCAKGLLRGLGGVPAAGELHAASHIRNRTRCSTISSASGIVSVV